VGSIGIDRLIDEGCDSNSRKEHEERMEGGEGELIETTEVRTLVPCTNLNNDILNLERSREPRTQARSLK